MKAKFSLSKPAVFFSCIFLSIFFSGCSNFGEQKLDPQLKLMPSGAALSTIKKHIAAADTDGFAVSGMTGGKNCLDFKDKAPYSSIYQVKHHELAGGRRGVHIYTHGEKRMSLCFVGVYISDISRAEANDLSAALLAMGANISSLSTFTK